MFCNRKKSKPVEPLFTGVRSSDEEMLRAYRFASESLNNFRSHIRRAGEHTCAAKLKFKDPALSEKLGEDRFIYLWLLNVELEEDNIFVAAFFEVPPELLEWHQPGQQLQFEGEDIFDWFVNDDGTLYGGYTMRVARTRLPANERAAYDNYTGVKHWVPTDQN